MATHFEWDEAKRIANIPKHGLGYEAEEFLHQISYRLGPD